MKFIYLVIISFVLTVAVASCKTTHKAQATDLTTDPTTGQAKEADTPMDLVQKPVILNHILGKKLYWVQTIYNDKSTSKPQEQEQEQEQERRAYIIFQEKNHLQIQSICNMGLGSYVLDDKSLALHLQMTTRMACKDAKTEYNYFKNLRSVNQMYQVGNKIIFSLASGEGTMEFELLD